jgi:hypothetical protein
MAKLKPVEKLQKMKVDLVISKCKFIPNSRNFFTVFHGSDRQDDSSLSGSHDQRKFDIAEARLQQLEERWREEYVG